MTKPKPWKVVGRYTLFEPFATGGMATVHLAHIAGDAGFSRVVAAKRMKPELLGDTSFVSMFQDEAQLASRVVHPNVVPILDVVRDDDELVIVMEYVRGTTLRDLLDLLAAENVSMPVDIAVSIIGGVLEGLNAAHGARGDDGWLLGLVHRDVSPQNILIGVDGIPRLVDFGVAKAVTKLHVTAAHEVRGKLRYMAPERVLSHPSDLRVDVYSAGIVLWEMLANRRRYTGDDLSTVMDEVLKTDPPRLRRERPGVPAAVDQVIARATARMADARYASAEAMLSDLEAAATFASKRAVATWLARAAEPILSRHEDVTRAIRAHIRMSSMTNEGPVGDDDPTEIDPLDWEPLPERMEALREMSLTEAAPPDDATKTIARAERPQQTVRLIPSTQRLRVDALPPIAAMTSDPVSEPIPQFGVRSAKRAAMTVIGGLALLVLAIVLIWRG